MMLRVTFALAMVAGGGLIEQSPEPAVSVIIATTTRFTFVAAEQDLHPDEDELYMGGLYDVRVRDVRVLAGAGNVRGPERIPIRVVMTHAPRQKRPMLMVIVRYDDGLPVAAWWDWADRGRTCVPSDVIERFALRLLVAAKAGKLCAG